MSTVQSLLDDLQFRVDVDADLYHIINQAIRRVAKRLYWHHSDILRQEMALNLYAEQTYTASTIAFVSGSPATLTDSANQFAIELFKPGMFITTDSTVNPGPYEIATVAAGIITLVASSANALTDAIAGTSVTITSLADRVSLPSDFWGLCGNNADDYPYVDTYHFTLKPLPSMAALIVMPPGSTPIYFKIKGRTLHLTPSTGADITIKGDYFARPAAVTAKTDTLPFYELFDDAFGEVVSLLYEKGLSSQMENAALLDKLCNDAVDLVVANYDQRAPVEVSGGIDWDINDY